MELKDLKVIDWDKRGNVVRFFLGKKELNDWWGDDWNDSPYEHNAGNVYNEFIEGYIDMAWDLDVVVAEPSDGCYSSSYCKDDFKYRNIPIIAIHKLKEKEYAWEYEDFRSCFVKADEKVCMNDDATSLLNKGNVLKTCLSVNNSEKQTV